MARASARIEGGGRTDFVALGWVGLASVALVYATLVVERLGVEHALHLMAPAEARPGSEVAVSAYVFDWASESGEPELARADITVTIERGETTVATSALTLSVLDVASGTLTVPTEPGDYSVHARARLGGSVVATARRPLHVAADAAPAPDLPRTAPLLQHFQVGPIVTAAGELPPPRFDVRVQSGVCVPETPCTLLVDLGAAGYDVELAPGSFVALDGLPRSEGTLFALTMHVNGPEGDGELVVRRAGIEVARRSVRLPVALATPWLRVDDDAARSGRLAVEVDPPPGTRGAVIDVFRDGQWWRSVTLETRSSDDLVGEVPPGIYRVEARTDPFRSDRVTSRVVRVGDGGPDAPPPLRQEGLAFAMAAAEEELVGLELPEAVSGLEGDQATLGAQQQIVRWLAMAGMAVAIVMVIVTVARRGAVAATQASALMKLAAGEEGALSARRANLSLVLAIAALALGLLGGGALVLARQIVIGG